MFVDRNEELAFLNGLFTRQQPGTAQLALVYGRRRVGKTELLLHWARNSGVTFTYWAALRETADLQRKGLFAQILGVGEDSAPIHRSWPAMWKAIADLIQDKLHILILDELPYAADSDPAMLSALQHAWDQLFQNSRMVIVLCGSHVRVMETLLSRQSPLFGRMTAQWHLGPLPFSSLREFYPAWKPEERVAAYAIAGGIPAYLRWMDASRSLTENIRDVILNPGGMFLAEPAFLLYDEVREPKHYLAILKAVGAGCHTLTEISDWSFIPRTSVNVYLNTLQELRLIERQLPATLRPGERARSRAGRYHLSDPYFRFYFHFIAPFQEDKLDEPDEILQRIQANLRAFVGATAFEDLARQWVIQQGKAGRLPFVPQAIGSHWSSRVQVDVVSVNWNSRDILLGECKWGVEKVDRQVIRDLLETKTPLVLRDLPEMGEGWKIHHFAFARQGFTPAAKEEMKAAGGMLVDLSMMDELLGK